MAALAASRPARVANWRPCGVAWQPSQPPFGAGNSSRGDDHRTSTRDEVVAGCFISAWQSTHATAAWASSSGNLYRL